MGVGLGDPVPQFFLNFVSFFLDSNEKNRSKIFGSPIPIPNFPKIPKIILRTPCDDSKEAKNQKPFCKIKNHFFLLNIKYRSSASDILCTAHQCFFKGFGKTIKKNQNFLASKNHLRIRCFFIKTTN